MRKIVLLIALVCLLAAVGCIKHLDKYEIVGIYASETGNTVAEAEHADGLIVVTFIGELDSVASTLESGDVVYMRCVHKPAEHHCHSIEVPVSIPSEAEQ